MNETIIKAVEIVVAKEIEKATAHTLAELARVQSQRDIAQAERDQARAFVAQVQSEALDKLHATWAEHAAWAEQLHRTIEQKRELILGSLRSHFADKVKSIETTQDGGYQLNADETDALVRDLANNCAQAAFMADDEPAPTSEPDARPISWRVTDLGGVSFPAGHSPRTFVDIEDSASRIEMCTCGLKFTSQNPDDEYAAHVAAVTGIAQTKTP